MKDLGTELWCLGFMRVGGSDFKKFKRAEQSRDTSKISLKSLNMNEKEPEGNGGLSNSKLPVYKKKTLASTLPPVSVQGI